MVIGISNRPLQTTMADLTASILKNIQRILQEQGESLASLHKRFDDMDVRFGAVHRRLDGDSARFDAVHQLEGE